MTLLQGVLDGLKARGPRSSAVSGNGAGRPEAKDALGVLAAEIDRQDHFQVKRSSPSRGARRYPRPRSAGIDVQGRGPPWSLC